MAEPVGNGRVGEDEAPSPLDAILTDRVLGSTYYT